MSARSDKSKQAAGILRSGFNAEMLALLLFSILFVVLVRLDQDTHYVNLITERASFRGTPFSASRVLAPTLVRLVQSAGISILSASLLVDFLACAAGMFAFAGFVRQVCRQQVGLLLPATLLMLCLAANSIVLSDISYPDDLLAVLLFSAGLWAIASSHTGVYYFALVLGTLNRETAVYLVPSFLLLNLARYFEQGRHGGGEAQTPGTSAVSLEPRSCLGRNLDPDPADPGSLLFRREPRLLREPPGRQPGLSEKLCRQLQIDGSPAVSLRRHLAADTSGLATNPT